MRKILIVRCASVQGAEGISVTCRDGRIFTGAAVIVALAPALYLRIAFAPPLPPLRVVRECCSANVLRNLIDVAVARSTWHSGCR